MTVWYSSISRSAKRIAAKQRCLQKKAGNLGNQIGSPDAIIIFTNTVSHQMVKFAVTEAEKANADVIRCHTS